MTKNFNDLRAQMSPDARARSEAKAQVILNEMALSELREAVNLTQESLAEALGVKQASISKMEHRSDMYLSTLRKIIEAMGGRLEIVAIMPDGPVRIKQFKEIHRAHEPAAAATATAAPALALAR
jgi:transcriptional regulator with XRE-family HTH domain